jgi:hypothetical protein
VIGKRTSVSQEAQDKYAADTALAQQFDELLERARAAEQEYRDAEAARAPEERLRGLGKRLDAALTDVMRSAFAAQRVEIGPLGYDDWIYRRKALATPKVHALTREAQRLLTLRETHRLTGIPRLPRMSSAV